jgi:predicted phosphodiesterase
LNASDPSPEKPLPQAPDPGQSRILPGTIGILADSHGDRAGTAAAIARLRHAGAEQLVHLGDIFDSRQRKGMDALMGLLLKAGVRTVKGNNDFLLESRLREAEGAGQGPLLAFLRNLPLCWTEEDLCFAHSLPGGGIRAFYEPVDPGHNGRAIQLFRDMPYRLLFCGHSHHPILFRRREGEVTREEIPSDVPVPIRPEERYIFVCGAVEAGECALFDRRKSLYRRIRI